MLGFWLGLYWISRSIGGKLICLQYWIFPLGPCSPCRLLCFSVKVCSFLHVGLAHFLLDLKLGILQIKTRCKLSFFLLHLPTDNFWLRKVIYFRMLILYPATLPQLFLFILYVFMNYHSLKIVIVISLPFQC